MHAIGLPPSGGGKLRGAGAVGRGRIRGEPFFGSVGGGPARKKKQPLRDLGPGYPAEAVGNVDGVGKRAGIVGCPGKVLVPPVGKRAGFDQPQLVKFVFWQPRATPTQKQGRPTSARHDRAGGAKQIRKNKGPAAPGSLAVQVQRDGYRGLGLQLLTGFIRVNSKGSWGAGPEILHWIFGGRGPNHLGAHTSERERVHPGWAPKRFCWALQDVRGRARLAFGEFHDGAFVAFRLPKKNGRGGC